jgi:hypothetical protein
MHPIHGIKHCDTYMTNIEVVMKHDSLQHA